MIKLHLIYSLMSLLIISSCRSETHEDKYTEVKIEERPVDFKVPKKMFEQIETDLIGTSAVQPVYLFTPLQVVLFSESDTVLKNLSTRISFPNGGGKLDLADYVSGQGSFYLSFPKEQFEKLPTLEKLYFISDTPKKTIDSEEFGIGCGKFVDIRKQFEFLQNKNFLKLNTTELRHLYVVTGYYVFVFKNSSQIYFTHLHVIDSRYPDNFCSSLYKQ
jgi:hypothetical protein